MKVEKERRVRSRSRSFSPEEKRSVSPLVENNGKSPYSPESPKRKDGVVDNASFSPAKDQEMGSASPDLRSPRSGMHSPSPVECSPRPVVSPRNSAGSTGGDGGGRGHGIGSPSVAPGSAIAAGSPDRVGCESPVPRGGSPLAEEGSLDKSPVAVDLMERQPSKSPSRSVE